MRPSFLRSIAVSVFFTAAVLLTGCGVGLNFPDVPAASSELPVGPIQGSNYGGHAPLVGAHVFVLEGTPSSDYYQPAKSLLNVVTTGNYPTSVEPAGTAVAGFNYVTTDAHGDFNISGDYTCTSGDPVYLYAEGGNPETNPLNYFQVYITKVVVAGNTFTFTNLQNAATTNLMYQGETVVLSGFTGALAPLNGTSQTVLSNGLMTTTFQVTSPTNLGIANNTYGTGATTLGIATQSMPVVPNPAVVNLAVLGVCGDNGATNFSSLPFVYMNEVSTVAAAYALAGFFPPPGNANLAVAGAAAANLSVPSSDTLALTGLQDAARTASQLYDIAGGNVACTGLGCDGETHIARTTTPVGNGTVPQALIDTLGNILANCVDSANTSVVTANESTQCSALFADTLSAGSSGTRPIDTATAAIDMAHNPWSNATALVDLPSGNAPFQPIVASANDLSVGIQFTPAHIGKPQGIAVDGFGQVWYTNAGSGYVTTLSPLGGVMYNQLYVAGEVPTYVVIDIHNNAWYGDEADMGLHEVYSGGTYHDTGVVNSMTNPYGIASDGNGNVYVSLNQEEYGQVYDFTNGADLTNPPVNPLTGVNDASCLGTTKVATTGDMLDADHMAIDNQSQGYNLWISSEVGDVICEVSSTNGGLLQTFQIGPGQTVATTTSPEFLAIDSYGSVWVASQFNNTMHKITYHANGGTLSQLGGVTLSTPFGAAMDGANNVFVTNRGSNDIAEYLGNTSAAVSTVRFEGGGNASVMSDPLNDAVDPSGNLWIANYTSGRIVEMVGLATPTYTPLSIAALNNKLGSKP